MLPLKANVPPPKLNVAPVPALHVPVQLPPQMPPPVKFSVPPFAFTVPLLLNATLTLLETPPVICNVPALLNAGATPPLKIMPFPKPLLPFTMLQVAPARLFTTAPVDRNSPLPPVAFPNVVVPDTFNVRASSVTLALGMLIPPLAFVTPAPFIAPPDQAVSPLTVTVEVPVNVPPVRVSAEVLTAPPTLLKFAVPLLIV